MTAERPDVDVLAELDAGLVDGVEVDEATVARRRAEAGPAAAGVLDALAATRAELRSVPPVALPQGATDRWMATLADLTVDPPTTADDEPVAPVVALEPRRRRPMRPALVAAAVLLVAVVTVGIVRSGADDRQVVSGVQLAGAAVAARGVQDAGAFADPARRAACLLAVAPGIRPDAPLLGATRVRYEGAQGVLLLLGTGRLGVFDVVVVDDACGVLLASRTVP